MSPMDQFTNTYKWVILPLLVISLVLSASLVPLPAEAASGNEYYVAPNGDDANPGTIGEPWRTLQKAADTMVADDTTYVRSGTYTRVNLKRSGASGQYITFEAYPGEHPVLDGGSWVGFVDRYADTSPLEYFIIDGFEIKNFEHGINLIQSNHFIIRNNKVHDNSSFGILVDGAEDGEIANNSVFNTGSYSGILVSNSTNIDIHHNVSYSNNHNGIGMSHAAHNNLVHHNIAYDNSCGADQRYAGIAIEVNSERNRVYNNLIYDNCHAGYLTNSPNNEIYNNVMYGNIGAQISFGDWEDSTPTGNVIMNNIFVVTRAGDQENAVACWGEGYDPLQNTFDYNLYYYVNGPDKSRMVVVWPIYSRAYSFSEWQAAGKEQHGVLGDPQFINPGNADFHLRSNSPAIDAGVDVGVTDDFDGNVRPQGPTPDIGAFEYVGSAATPTPQPSPTSPPPSSTQEPSPTALPPTPTQTSSPTPTPTDTPTLTSTLTITPSLTPTFTRTLTPSPTLSSTPLPADLNQDGQVDVLDTQLCVNVVLGTESDPVIVARADVNADGEVNVLDVQEIVNIMLAI
jgi:parallel beta-helix repeat protein